MLLLYGRGCFFFDQARHLEYLLYIVLGAGLSRGWRDCSFLWLYFSDFLFRFSFGRNWTLYLQSIFAVCICSLYLQSGAEWLLLLSTGCEKKLFPSQVLVTPFIPAIL